MIVTEEEAGTLWCPHARVIFNNVNDTNRTHAMGSYNRAVDGSDQQAVAEDRAGVHNNRLANCLGPRCMAWIWQQDRPGKAANGAKAKKADRKGRCGFTQYFANEV